MKDSSMELFKDLVRTLGMGEIISKVRLANEYDVILHEEGRLPKKKIRSVEVIGIIDTGAVMTLLPQDLVEKLGLRKIDTEIVTLANDQKVELARAGTLSLTMADREMKMDCLVGPPRCEVLIGQLVLERLDLIVDPRRQTVSPRPESPFLPMHNLKAAIHR
ncbi:MAG: aspartyl protease family protein [Elusimicrobia bacterium]|nr:aspartyl protease family protein [Elusimicrobiota bacterium]